MAQAEHRDRVIEKVTSFELASVGDYLASRLVEINLDTYFTVPGDFTLSLLDDLNKKPSLRMVGCCNELNAGYAADGYCRATGKLSCVVVTYCVGGLSVINAVAGAYSERLPLLVISGGPNSHDSEEHHLVHHTTGEIELYQCSQAFKPVVAKTFVVRHLTAAAGMIDDAISLCMTARRPVYLEIACNLVKQQLPIPAPMSFQYDTLLSCDASGLSAAVEDILLRLQTAVKPVLIAGSKLRSGNALNEFQLLANALQCGVATMPDAKSLFNEAHPLYMGTYWSGISSLHVEEVVQSADLLIFVGPIFNDYTTTGWTALLDPSKLIIVHPDHTNVCKRRYSCLRMADLLSTLAVRAPMKPATHVAFKRYWEKIALAPTVSAAPECPLTLVEIKRQVQAAITPNTSIIVETGDSWFMGQSLQLPEGAQYHIQMQYGSIGWALGATLGVGLAVKGERKVLALIGDGSFQVTAQEMSTMIRRNVKATVILLNNQGYTIEVEIHDGPYNDIQDWNYAGLVDIFNAGSGNGLGLKATTAGELTEAMERAEAHPGFALIECRINRDDCTGELLLWGSRVAAANMRT